MGEIKSALEIAICPWVSSLFFAIWAFTLASSVCAEERAGAVLIPCLTASLKGIHIPVKSNSIGGKGVVGGTSSGEFKAKEKWPRRDGNNEPVMRKNVKAACIWDFAMKVSMCSS